MIATCGLTRIRSQYHDYPEESLDSLLDLRELIDQWLDEYSSEELLSYLVTAIDEGEVVIGPGFCIETYLPGQPAYRFQVKETMNDGVTVTGTAEHLPSAVLIAIRYQLMIATGE